MMAPNTAGTCEAGRGVGDWLRVLPLDFAELHGSGDSALEFAGLGVGGGERAVPATALALFRGTARVVGVALYERGA